ncbi:MAG TPA: hypothetical protein VIK68_03490 [Sphingomicrobium sp.]
MGGNEGIAGRVAFLGNLGAILFPIGAIALLVVPGIWFYQAREWLASGKWPSVSVADGLNWAGVALPNSATALATDKFLQFPLSLVLLFLIGGPLIAYARFSEQLDKKADAKHHVDAA